MCQQVCGKHDRNTNHFFVCLLGVRQHKLQISCVSIAKSETRWTCLSFRKVKITPLLRPSMNSVNAEHHAFSLLSLDGSELSVGFTFRHKKSCWCPWSVFRRLPHVATSEIRLSLWKSILNYRYSYRSASCHVLYINETLLCIVNTDALLIIL